jgi:hypothetical protein
MGIIATGIIATDVVPTGIVVVGIIATDVVPTCISDADMVVGGFQFWLKVSQKVGIRF